MPGDTLKGSRRHVVIGSVLVVAATVVALFVLQWHWLDRFEQAAGKVLEGESARAAGMLAQQITREFKAPLFTLIEQLNHDDARQLRLDALSRALHQRAEHARLVDMVFVWSGVATSPPAGSGRPEEQVHVFSMRELQALEHDRPDAAAPRRFTCDPELSAAVLAQARPFATMFANYALARITYRGRAYELVYHLLYNWPDRRRVEAILGFAIDEQRLRERYFATLFASQAGLATVGPADLAVSVVDDRGTEVYRTGPSLAHHYEASAPFPFLFYDVDLIESLHPFKPEVRYWSVRTAHGRSDIATLVGRQTNSQRLFLAGAGVVALAGVLLTLRSAAREMRIARLKSDFVASVSHDLKTPLAKIALFADTLRAGRVRSPEKLAEYSEIIGTQARLLDEHLSDILHVARIDAGRREYGADDLDLKPLLQRTVDGYRPALDEQGFAVEVDTPPTAVPVTGDADALRQVFENLIGNAIKYSGQVRALSIVLERVGSHARVTFSDRGIGIAPRDHRRIFDRFVRIRQPGTSSVAGSGLGLSIARHVVRAHGGRLAVRSSPGEGSTFAVTLPVRRDPREEPRA